MHDLLPPLFLERMAALLGGPESAEYRAFAASYDRPAVTGLRANTLKASAAELAARLPFALAAVPWSAEGFIVQDADAASAGRPGKHPYHAAGLYYLQEPSALAPVELLDPRPGERVLDLAAAPGGKATHIAARLQGEGLLVANEIHGRRAWDLAENLERCGVRNAAVTNETPERLAERFGAWFDAVLVDAPCSGEGMLRKSAAARQEWTPELAAGCAVRQANILAAAARLVRPGGRLVYATCTFAPEEDERAVARFLAARPDFDLPEPPRRPGFAPGRPDWLPADERDARLAHAVRLWPHHVAGEGHFAARLMRRADAEQEAGPRPARSERLPKAVEAAYRAFVAETLAGPPADAVMLAGAYLYAVLPGLPDLAGLRFLHPGWWLGTARKERFEPSHALALGLRAQQARRVADFPADGPETARYLRGETLASTGEDGWTLVTVDGYPLGWGKRVAGRLKSHYPRGLRPVK